MIAPLVLEGTWDEISARADELRGWRLRVVTLSPVDAERREQSAAAASSEQPGTGASDAEASTMGRKRYVPTPVAITDEGPATFDFYRPKGGKRVPYRKGGRRVPTIVLENHDTEADRV